MEALEKIIRNVAVNTVMSCRLVGVNDLIAAEDN